MPAERMRYRRNNSDLTNAVVEAIAPRCFAVLVRNLVQRPIFSHTLENFIQGYNHLRRPYAIFFERHELDKAYDYPLLARELAKWDDLVFVEGSHQYAVHLDRT